MSSHRQIKAKIELLINQNRLLLDALRPFAKAGELFPGAPGECGFDQCIYNPAAGAEYSLCGDDLRRARIAFAEGPQA